MIHHQQRRDLAASPDSDDESPEALSPSPAVPRQERRPARDAYDLYAQIYAIRTEDHTS